MIFPAYLLIRMMNHFMGEKEFHKGVRKYFNQYNLKNSSLDQVWTVFNEIAEETNRLSSHTTVKSIMESWTKNKGYALITMERDYARKMVTLKQVNLRELVIFSVLFAF